MSNIKVAVRVRPPIESELRNGDQLSWITRGNNVYMGSGKNAFYTFDYVFDCTSTNRDVYEKYCHPIVESVMQGFNGTIFAFGQTSSGKTHTMLGTDKQPGLIPSSIEAIFNIIESEPLREYLIRVSYIEIYNENIMDLLDAGYGKSLQIRDNADGQPTIVDLTELTVRSKEQVQAALRTGECRRHVSSTEANQRSSRSHTIFRLNIESTLREEGADEAVSVGQLNLVDLAGSERSEQCGDVVERFRESTRINLSLTFLTQVISKLSRGERGHINFRDSKLTRILRNSLGGNAHTAIVCTINPFCVEQTHRTLQFASSAKKIQNTPVVNEIMSNDTQLRRYHRQLEELRGQIKAMMEDRAMCKTLQEKNSEIDELKDKVRSLEEKLVVSTLPAPPVAEWRKQRRETWAAPSCIVHTLNKARTAPEGTKPHEALDVFQDFGRLSTVIEESESFQAVSNESFEKHLQREERSRRSAALHLGDAESSIRQTCNDVACAERIKFLENELVILRKEHEELKELTTLEHLLCSTSRRPVPSGKLDEAASTTPPPVQLKDCCAKAVLACKRSQERASCRLGGFQFFSPLYTSPRLTAANGNSSTSSSSSHSDQEGEERAQASKPHARLTPRTTLWTPSNSPVVGTPGTPGLNPLMTRTPQACIELVPKPLFVDGATQTDDTQCTQMLQQNVTSSCNLTQEDSMSQNILPVVSCQTDSENGCKKPVPSTGEWPGASGAEPVHHSSSCASQDKRDSESQVNRSLVDGLVADSAVQATTGMQSCASQTDVDRKEAVDCATQCSSSVQNCEVVDSEAQTAPSMLECAMQTELSLLQHSISDDGVKNVDCSVQCSSPVQNCEVVDSEAQTALSVLECAVQTEPSLMQHSVADDDVKTVECGVQCSALQYCEVVDSEAQTALSMLECAVQTELSLLLHSVADNGVQAMPSLLDAATETEQASKVPVLGAGVQAESPCSHNSSMQTECCVHDVAVADCETQAVAFTMDNSSQVNSSLESQENSLLESTPLSFVKNNSSCLDKSSVSQVWTPSFSGKTNHWQKPSHVGKALAALRASLLQSSEESASDTTLTSDGQSTPSQCFGNDVANSPVSASALGTQTEMVVEKQVPKISMADTCAQTKLSSHDKLTQSVPCIFQHSVTDGNAQAVPSSSESASQVNKSLASWGTRLQFAQCSANNSNSTIQKSSVSKPVDAASKPPAYSARMSASGNGTLQQNCPPRRRLLDVLRENAVKPTEDPLADSGSRKAPLSCFNSASSTFRSGTSAPENRTWLHPNQKAKESVAVQTDTCTQELEQLRCQVSSLKLSLEQARRDMESQLRAQEKAAKKKELQLKAMIRQLQNKERHLAHSTPSSPKVATLAEGKAQPPRPAKDLVHESPASLVRLLKTMTPRAREGARLIYFGQSLEEQTVAEQVQVAQLKASLSAHARKLESARKRQQAWADHRSSSKDDAPKSPLKELNTEPIEEIKEPASCLDDSADDMRNWRGIRHFMEFDKENDSP